MPDREQEALSILLNAEHYPLLEVHPAQSVLLRLWRRPTFQNPTSWTLIGSGSGLHLRRLIWYPSHGYPELSIYGSEAMIAPQRWAQIRQPLRAMKFTPFPFDDEWGRDGTLNGFEMHTGLRSAYFTWKAEEPPARWEDLNAWHQRAIDAFEQALPASVPPGDR